MDTSCEFCMFRQNDLKGIQTGCFFGRLEAFKEAGVEVLDLDHKLIKGRICNLCYQQDPDSNLSFQESADLALEKAEIKCDVIVYVENENQLKESIRKINGSRIKPVTTIIMNPNRLDFTKLMVGLKTKWTIISSTGSLILDDALDKVKADYFAYNVTEAGFLTKADNALNRKMIRFFMIYGDEGIIVNTKAFRYFAGKSENLPDKLINLPEELKIGKMTYEWSEIFNDGNSSNSQP